MSAQTSSCAGFSDGTLSVVISVISVPCSRLTSCAADTFVQLDTSLPSRLAPSFVAACALHKVDSAPLHSVTSEPSLLRADMHRSWTLSSLGAP